jgi:hypothetical protein
MDHKADAVGKVRGRWLPGLRRLGLSAGARRPLLLGGLCVGWVLFGGYVWWFCGSWQGVVDAVRGRVLSVEARGLRIVEGEDEAEAELVVRNVLPREVLVLGTHTC